MFRSLALSFVLVSAVAAQSNTAAYHQIAKVPAGVNGQSFSSFAFDPTDHRLYASSRDGLFWLNVDADRPVWHGPTFKDFLMVVRFAPELRRVFFSSIDDVGYVDVDALDKPHLIARNLHAGGLVYEPQAREVYASHRGSSVFVFNGQTGERSGTIEVPGWFAQLREAIPGQVFLTLPNKEGLYTINAASHRIGPWPVDGKIEKPAYMEVDLAGKYIFLSYDRNIVAIDTATAKVVGRMVAIGTAPIAFDSGSNLLVTAGTVQTAPARLMAYRVDANGFTLVSSMDNPAVGETRIGVEPTNHGFIQRRGTDWLLWKAEAPR